MKKILCLTDGLSLGGAERQLIGLSHFLQEKGYNVELCSYLKRNFYETLIESYKLNAVCLDVHGGKIKKLIALYKHLKNGRYDCVIAYKDGATMASCMLKMLGMRFRLIVSERNTNIRRSRYDDFKFWMYKHADFVVPNSYSQNQFIKECYPKLSPKTVTISNFTDIKFFLPSEYLNHNNENIMVAARISSQKNIPNFMKAIVLLKRDGLRFNVRWFGNVSNGEEKYEAYCRALITEFDLSDVFSFEPATNNILSEYQKCDVFCLPSLFEGYPNAICEAMSCAKPILCSRVCDNPVIVEENKNGFLFDPCDIDDIYRTIRRFICLSNEDKEEMGKQSRTIAERKFSEDVFIGMYINLIESK